MNDSDLAGLSQNIDPALLGFRIRSHRLAKGLRQADLAEESGQAIISTAYVSRIENGERRPSFQVLTSMAQTLGIPVEVLLVEETDQALGDRLWQAATDSLLAFNEFKVGNPEYANPLARIAREIAEGYGV